MPGLNGDGRMGRVNSHGHNGQTISVDSPATAGEAITLPPMTDESHPRLEVPSPPPDSVPSEWSEREAWLVGTLAGVDPEERAKYIEAHYAFFLAASQPRASFAENRARQEALEARPPEIGRASC